MNNNEFESIRDKFKTTMQSSKAENSKLEAHESILPSTVSRKRRKETIPQFSFQQLLNLYDRLEKKNEVESKLSLQMDFLHQHEMGMKYNAVEICWEKIATSDDCSHRFTGFTVQEFLKLVTQFKQELMADFDVHQGRPGVLLRTVESRLLFFLNWLKFGMNFDLLSATFGLSHSYGHSVIVQLIERCTKPFEAKYIIKLTHKDQAERGYLFAKLPQVAVIIDCTDQLIATTHKRFHNDQSNQFYSYKLNHSGFRTLTSHSCNGLVMFYRSAPAVRSELMMAMSELLTVRVD